MFEPIALIKRPHREDRVFLRKSDLQQDYPADATVEVIARGGIVIATKDAGLEKLTIKPGINVDDYFEG